MSMQYIPNTPIRKFSFLLVSMLFIAQVSMAQSDHVRYVEQRILDSGIVTSYAFKSFDDQNQLIEELVVKSPYIYVDYYRTIGDTILISKYRMRMIPTRKYSDTAEIRLRQAYNDLLKCMGSEIEEKRPTLYQKANFVFGKVLPCRLDTLQKKIWREIHDEHGNLLKREQLKDNVFVTHVEHTYDENNNLVHTKNWEGETKYAYDDKNRLITFDWQSEYLNTVQVRHFEYDNDKNTTYERLANGKKNLLKEEIFENDVKKTAIFYNPDKSITTVTYNSDGTPAKSIQARKGHILSSERWEYYREQGYTKTTKFVNKKKTRVVEKVEYR